MKKKYKKFQPEWYYWPGSTRVYKATYNPQHLSIIVEFTDRVQWEYFQCTAQDWADFIGAGSPGKFVYERLDPKPNGSTTI